MRNSKFWTQETVNSFTQFIESKGGKINKILELREGYQFSIQPPKVCTVDQWGAKMMDEFEGQR